MRGLTAFALFLTCAAPWAVAQDMPPVPLSVPTEQPASDATPTEVAPPNIVVAAPAALEQLPLMVIDQEELFLGSLWGKRVQKELETRSHALATENDVLANNLSREEQQLTELRKTLPVEEFRARADEFDKRVVEVRRERDAKARELQQHADNERGAFFQAALPILAKLMQERGAVAVLDQRVLFVSADSIDVTKDLIALVDKAEGAGTSALDQTKPAQKAQPETTPEATPAPETPSSPATPE